MAGLFITGTDTDCGKTAVTLGLMYKLQQQGEVVLGMKPVASGAQMTEVGLRNNDALRIQEQASIEIPYSEVNPFVYQSAIAPHLAARQVEMPILIDDIVDGCEQMQEQADWVLVEGVGGWHVPLGDDVTLADLCRSLNLPVILVVGMRLGCINHALMSAECMLNAGVNFAGWIANHRDSKMLASEENLETLRIWLPAPCLGEIPSLMTPSPQNIAEYLTEQLIF
ncbi:MAG: dethiobiotin synthase [Candidatus Thiodiazotropha sp.]|jgi:dethiobiotin synthetase